jgi:type IV pilus assembly protein PilV
MHTPQTPSLNSSQQGVVLLEALISILIFSLAVLALVGLQASMVKGTTNAKFRSDASYIVQQRIGAMWANPSNLASFEEENTDISDQLPGGLRTVTLVATGQYQITVTWQVPGEAQHNFTTFTTITGG